MKNTLLESIVLHYPENEISFATNDQGDCNVIFDGIELQVKIEYMTRQMYDVKPYIVKDFSEFRNEIMTNITDAIDSELVTKHDELIDKWISLGLLKIN